MVALQDDGMEKSPEGGASISHEVTLSSVDSTLDVFFSSSGVLSSLSQGMFRSLRSAVRADTGVKEGRYFFEVQVLEAADNALLQVGFSTDRSPLLGQFRNRVAFDANGSFITSEPGASTELPEACKPFGRHVVGVLVELCQGPDAGTPGAVSVFIDGRSAGEERPLPPLMAQEALFPTLTFQNVTLAVNFGSVAWQALPDGCRIFGTLLEKDHARSSVCRSKQKELIVPVGLPGTGLHDYSRRLREENPDVLEIGDGMIEEWCLSSGLERSRAPNPEHSSDEPDLEAFGEFDPEARRTLGTLARLSGRSLVRSSVGLGLLEAERRALLQQHPDARKIAAVLLGSPPADFREWVKMRQRADIETKKVLGEEPPDEASETLCSGVPDAVDKALGEFARFTLPSRAEGFDEVRYEWAGEEAAKQELLAWQQQRKASHVVTGLKPGEWFHSQMEAWKKLKQALKQGQISFAKKADQNPALSGLAAEINLEDVKDVHNGDGKGTPIYANFKYEDWIVLSWRYELHLLCHSFLVDAADPERRGIPEGHVDHYWKVYFHHHFDPRKLGAKNLEEALKILKEPAQLIEAESGPRLLQSTLDKDAPFEVFVSNVEAYRRDRTRRIEAGDESAKLSFPKPQAKQAAAPAKVKQPAHPPPKPPAKAVPKQPSQPPKAPVPKKPREPSTPPPKALVKRIAKAPAKGGAATVSVAKAPQKRPMPEATLPLAKRPRPIGASGQPPIVKAPVAKRKPA